MAAMALQLRSKCRTSRNPSVLQLFSSSTDSNGGDDKDTPSPSPPPSTPAFSDVKASLRQSPPPRRVFPSPSRESPSFSSMKPSKVASLEEIRKNLSEFRRRSAAPLPDETSSSSSSSQTISFQELYKRNVIGKGEEVNTGVGTGKSGKLSFEAIRESLRQLRSSTGNQNMNDRFRGQPDRGNRGLDPMSLTAFKDSLKLRPDDPAMPKSFVFGGSDSLPASVFGREIRAKTETESQALKTEFVKIYSYDELGEKLRKLRPADAKGFSLDELNERLMKLREIEEKETESRIGGISFKDLRESLVKLRMSDDDKSRKSSSSASHIHVPCKLQSIPLQYFHPDCMSSEEKMKLELNKVRDDFKMSESDCGSARVQVAQLTTKIKHLSSVLHKKDKHSRKGLVGMVQRRKKLLKYLRRTDWDSYCFVLSKLGLRDNPDYKN
ncbi:hypothetical protein HHK36_005096 [Tetracentron sinense]|uniref:Small ribosomal subunit protein uS15c n=1 Tax=Tetracentron sinense TaxID=13715 RepID=A0A835DQF2_TETSI|nr:hypothetical protein HHK36_005096 [Tetracentron sinense]